jgi:hypothetical protein
MRYVAILSCAVLLAACGGSTSSMFDGTNDQGDGGPGTTPVFNNTDGAVLFDDGGSTSVPMCSAAAKLVYVIDDMGVLHSFDPPSLTFKTIGTVACPSGNGTNSMAIDRNATAWVCDNDGNLFKVSTANAACQPTPFVIGQNGWRKFGMGFSSDQPGGAAETLYVSETGGTYGAHDSKGLGKIDLTTFKLSPIAQMGGNLAGYSAELTGTGDAKLFGFFTVMPASVAEIDKASAAILSNAAQATVNTGTDWAFSFWGGDFYLYTADTRVNKTATTDVTRFRPSDGTTTVVLPQIGFRIVGAGVSTCAPTQPIK